MSDRRPLHLFEGFGIELEYMIVDRDTLDVAPIADRLLEAAAGNLSGDHEDGPIAWSNELVLHVIELKTNGPAPSLLPLPGAFNTSLAKMQRLLDAQLAAGTQALVVAGSTGEAAALDDGEFEQLLSVAVTHVGGRVPRAGRLRDRDRPRADLRTGRGTLPVRGGGRWPDRIRIAPPSGDGSAPEDDQGQRR